MRYLHGLAAGCLILSCSVQEIILPRCVSYIDLTSQLLSIEADQMRVRASSSPNSCCIIYLLLSISCYVVLQSRNTSYAIETLIVTISYEPGILLLHMQLVLLLSCLNI